MKYVIEMNEHEKTELLNQIEERRKQHVADLETALFNLKNNPRAAGIQKVDFSNVVFKTSECRNPF